MTGILIQVALGGALGALARHMATLVMTRSFGVGFPWGTLLVNITGSFLMGVLVVLLAERGTRATPFLMTGVLGGFTTFSAFSLDAVTLWERGAVLAATAYVAGSFAASLVALVAGMALVRGLA